MRFKFILFRELEESFMAPLKIPPGVSLGCHQSKARMAERKAERQCEGGCGWQGSQFWISLCLLLFRPHWDHTITMPSSRPRNRMRKIISFGWVGLRASSFIYRKRCIYVYLAPVITNDLHFKTNHRSLLVGLGRGKFQSWYCCYWAGASAFRKPWRETEQER